MNRSRDRKMAKVKKTESPSQGAWRLFLLVARRDPKEGVPMGKPRPKKSRAVKVVMLAVRIKGTKLIVEVRALGRMCLKIMYRLDWPRDLAALTYSKFLVLRNSALTMPTN